MTGRRIYCSDNGDFYTDWQLTNYIEHPITKGIQPGDYWKQGDYWHAMSPNGLMCNLSNHTVTEHKDGTMTVMPSILVSNGTQQWHGYLKNGTWEEY